MPTSTSSRTGSSLLDYAEPRSALFQPSKAYMKSHRWGGPKRENRREGDGTSKCYRWLAKDDLMTKTGYGYAKCLTVAGTATSATLQEMFVLEHPETTVQQNRSIQRKDRKKKRGTKRGYLAEKTVV